MSKNRKISPGDASDLVWFFQLASASVAGVQGASLELKAGARKLEIIGGFLTAPGPGEQQMQASKRYRDIASVRDVLLVADDGAQHWSDLRALYGPARRQDPHGSIGLRQRPQWETQIRLRPSCQEREPRSFESDRGHLEMSRGTPEMSRGTPERPTAVAVVEQPTSKLAALAKHLPLVQERARQHAQAAAHSRALDVAYRAAMTTCGPSPAAGAERVLAAVERLPETLPVLDPQAAIDEVFKLAERKHGGDRPFLQAVRQECLARAAAAEQAWMCAREQVRQAADQARRQRNAQWLRAPVLSLEAWGL